MKKVLVVVLFCLSTSVSACKVDLTEYNGGVQKANWGAPSTQAPSGCTLRMVCTESF